MAMGMVFTLVGTIPFGDTLCLHEFDARTCRTSSRGPPCRAGACARPIRRTATSRSISQVAPLNVGILYVFAMAGQGIIGAAIAGWSSDNKFSPHGRAPRREPDGLLRGHARHVARRRDDDLRHRPPRRHGALAGRARLGHLRAAARLLPLLHRGRRREQAHPVRPARGRERARLRLLHRVLGDEVRHVLLRRVRRGRHRLDAASSRSSSAAGRCRSSTATASRSRSATRSSCTRRSRTCG